MNTELLEALTILEKEKNISKDVMMEAIENSLLSACKNHFGTSDNIKIVMDRETCDYSVFAEKEVVEEVFDPAIEISLEDAEKINPSLHIGDIAHRRFRRQTAGDLHRGALAHAVDQQVGRRVKQDGAAHLVVPVVIVGEPPQRGLQPTDNDGRIGEGLLCTVGVHDGGTVGAEAQLAAGTVQVLCPAALGHRVVGHHGVQITAADHYAVPGLAHGAEGLGIVPVRLGQHRHPVALALQQAGNNGAAEAGMVDIAVRRHHQKVIVVPAPVDHLVPAHRQKFRSLYHTISRGS